MRFSLKKRLFFNLFLIITAFAFISGIVYSNNVRSVINETTKKEIAHDKVILKAHFGEMQSKLLNITNSISYDNTIATSLNLISNYEDPLDYNYEVFDIEKKTLITHLQKWLKDNDKLAIGLFDIKGNLVTLYRKHKDQVDIGYISYDSDINKVFKNYKDDKVNSIIPSNMGLNIKNDKIFDGYTYKDSYYLKATKAIYLDNNRVGYARIAFNINEDVVRFLNKIVNTKLFLSINDKKLIFQNDEYRKKYYKIEDNENFEFPRISIFNFKDSLDAVFIQDKNFTKSIVNKVYLEMIVQWLIGLFVIFLLTYKFIFKYVTKPLEKLRLVLQKMKNKEFITLKPKSKDEIGEIFKDVNSLSRELRNSLSLLDNYKDIMDESLIVTTADLNGTIKFVNDNFVSVSGYTQDEVIGRPHSIVRHQDTPKETFKNLWETIKDKKVWKGVLKNRKKDGSYYWVNVVIKPILDIDGNVREYIAVRHDITELMEQKEQLRTLLHTDSLIGLPNRRQLNEDIKNMSQGGSLAILNIDNFRQLNDFYGHSFGDKLIIELGKLISALLAHENEEIKLYRLDGDEFAILSIHEDTVLFNEKIHNIIRFVEYDNINIEEETVSIKLTAGISFENKEYLLQTAGMALQSARKKHKEIVNYDKANLLNKEYESNLEWTKKIKEAIEDFRVVPFFQPIIQNDINKTTKYEALIRILDKDTNKPVSPFFFLEVAKQTKYYTILTKIMLEKTFDEFAYREEEFSINLTIEDVLNKELQGFIFDLLNEYEIGDRAVFEIVESESIENFDEVISFIKSVKKFGCQIAIDDFGTGYSNFEYLMKLQADYIKIDGSMIKNIDTNENSRLVVETIVSFAKKMGMKTIAEFVENEDILKVVNELGIEYSQGYYFSPPKQELD